MIEKTRPRIATRSRRSEWSAVLLSLSLLFAAGAQADTPDGRTIRPGANVPNPGTQSQELANITFPAPYNVFEFVVTCGACHGGTVDQNAAHFGNWAGSNMASAARDPIFRANAQIVNGQVPGAGNMCFRCHSPNAWLSGRTDPAFNGNPDGSTLFKSILLSTDDEGISCEMCHRTIGGVTMKRADLDAADPVWNMMEGIDDWPHAGLPFPQGPVAGNPYGDATLQFNEGMSYGAKFPGIAEIFFSDDPRGTGYTGQTYGVYPPGWSVTGQIPGEPAYAADGSLPVHFEKVVGPPTVIDWVNQTVKVDYNAQAFSPEHTTYKNSYVASSEFCGACHDLTVPVANHGMPEQRTYTEWKYSDFGSGDPAAKKTRCQDCHMPMLRHEYSDDLRISLNPDPVLSGLFPYGKDRNPNGGTPFHKFAGANRALPEMMKQLYPEVDLEVIGAPTGRDTRIFPGMMSDRSSMWERTRSNTEALLSDAASVEILPQTGVNAVNGVFIDNGNGTYSVQVRVTNKTGHRIPSGYPDGRRAWINLEVLDNGDSLIYESGHYDPATATLSDNANATILNRALDNQISSNEVMVYEKVTGQCDAGMTACQESFSLINPVVLFDNRIPPAGFNAALYSAAGTKFVAYDPQSKVPFEDLARFSDNSDTVTYTFAAATPPAAARAAFRWQTVTREFITYLRDNDTSTYRPQGPPSKFTLNYPLEPNFLGSHIPNFPNLMDPDGQPIVLNDNWGGIAYGSWLTTGMGSPLLAAADDTRQTAAPVAPQLTVVNPPDPAFPAIKDPFSLRLDWQSVTGADLYEIWVRYGVDTTDPADPDYALKATADWDKIGSVPAGTTTFTHGALNVAKTYQYKIAAVNGKGKTFSTVATGQTPVGLPLNPINTMVNSVTTSSVTLSWYDQADNEIGFIIERQDVPPLANFAEIARITSPNAGDPPNYINLMGFGGVTWTDNSVVSGRSYNYQVSAYNLDGPSTPDLPVTAVVPKADSLSSTPAELTFTDQLAGTTSTSQQLIITNSGNLPLTLQSVTLAGLHPDQFVMTANTCGTSLAVGANCTVDISFQPIGFGLYSATLNVKPAPPFTTLAIGLSGTGLAPVSSVTPSALNFVPQMVGTASAAQTVTISNSGNTDLTLTGIASDSLQFSVSNNTCPATLAAGGTCTVDVTYAPTAAGTLNGKLNVSAAAPAQQQSVTLSGTGITPVTAVSPAAIDFGSQLRMTLSAEQLVTLSNTGTAPLEILGITVSNGQFGISANTCGPSLAIGGSCTIKVRFKPTLPGVRSATLDIATAAPASNGVVNLTGTTIVPTTILAPLNLSFGDLIVGKTSVSQLITVNNTGASTMAISGITTSDPQFAITASTCGATLAAGRACAVKIAFKPTFVGPASAVLTLQTSTPNGTWTAPLSGTGIAPVNAVTPTALAFGTWPVAKVSTVQTVTISNPGTAPLTFAGISLAGVDPTQFRIASKTCGTTLAAGSNCAVNLTFKPTSAGVKNGLLKINVAAPALPGVVTLSGTGQ